MKTKNRDNADTSEEEEFEKDEILDNSDREEELETDVENDDSDAFSDVDEEENVLLSPMSEDNNQLKLKKRTKNLTIPKLVDQAINQLNERTGSSIEAIRKFIKNQNPDMDDIRLRAQIKRYLRNCVKDGTMKQIKLSFKLTNKHEIKKRLKAAVRKEKRGEKEKLVNKVKKQAQKVGKPLEKKTGKIKLQTENTTEISKEKPKSTKKPKEPKAETIPEPSKIADKVAKVPKGTKAAEAVTTTIPRPKTMKKLVKVTAKEEMKEKNPTLATKSETPAKSTPAAATTAAKTGSRLKKK